MDDESDLSGLPSVREFADIVRANVSKVIVGKPEIIDFLLVALLRDGFVGR